MLVLLTASMAALALATTASLGLLVVAGTTDLLYRRVRRPPLTASTNPWALPAGFVAVVALGIALIRVVRVLRARACRRRLIRAVVPDGGTALPGDAAVLVEDDDVFAVATPTGRAPPGTGRGQPGGCGPRWTTTNATPASHPNGSTSSTATTVTSRSAPSPSP